MSSDSQRSRPDSLPSEGLTSLDEDWTQLRTLLLSPEQTQLDELRDRLDNRIVQPREVSRVLPEAFAVRGERDSELSDVLTPYVEQGFVSAVRKSPRAIVDAIAPIMGPAIRQAIARALQSMTQSFNRSLDESLSLRGLRWRVEAWRTGRPFAEVVLLHTLRYRVEQVFLIHRETGLLLHHLAAEGAVVQDQQVLSGMLTAIQNYARDSFGASQDQTLDQFQVGDWTVWIEQGSQAYLAGVIRGTPPATLREDFRDALDHIHAEQANALAHFDGNAAPFTPAQTHLERCVQAHYESSRQQGTLKVWILVGLILLVSAWLGWMTYQTHTRWSNLLTALRAEPGIVVTVARSTWGDYHLEGLRDPLAKDPSAMMAEAGLAPSTVTAVWAPYYALDPRLITTRAQSMLQPPRTVKLDLKGDTLVATGSAPIDWARETRRLAPLIPGIAHYRDEGLGIISIPDLLTTINQTVVHFSSGSSMLEPAELATLSPVASVLRDLDHAAFQSGQGVALEIQGSADETGSESINRQLSKARANAVLAVLGGERFGEATTITTRIAADVTQRVPRGASADLRIASLHATLAPSTRGKEMPSP
jgi:outer membrane protein OmpA-like peptidoglycan-associated protein